MLVCGGGGGGDRVLRTNFGILISSQYCLRYIVFRLLRLIESQFKHFIE